MRIRGWRPAWLLPVIVGALALLPFWPSVHAGFLSDDWFFVEAYHGTQPPFGWFVWRAVSALERIPTNFYRPLPFISLAAQIRVAGLDPVGLHVTNLLIHATTTALLFVLIRRLHDGRVFAPAAAALFFAVFPRRVEAVAWLSCRPDLLGAAFAVASLLLFDRFLCRRTRVAAIGALGAWLLALASKESVTALAVTHVALAWHHGPRGQSVEYGQARRLQRALLAASPFLLAVPVFLLWRRFVIGDWIGGYGAGVLHVDRGTVLWLAKHALYQVIPPIEAAAHVELTDMPWPVVLSAGAVLFAGLLFLLWSIRGQASCVVGLTWLVAGILPVVTLPISLSSTLNDRLLYLPGIGTAIVLSALVARVPWRAAATLVAIVSMCAGAWSWSLSERWAQAGELSDRLLTTLADIVRKEPAEHIYLAAVPDSLGGAYMLRNGIGHALTTMGVPRPMRVVPLSVYFVPPGDERPTVRASNEAPARLRLDSIGDEPAVLTALVNPGDLARYETSGPPDRLGRFRSVLVTLREPGRVMILNPNGIAHVGP